MLSSHMEPLPALLFSSLTWMACWRGQGTVPQSPVFGVYIYAGKDGWTHTTSCGVFLVSHERQCLSPASSHMACLRLPNYDTNLQLLLGPLAFEATGRNVRPD